MRTLKKLATGDLVAGICSILLVVVAFTKTWASYRIEFFEQSQSEGASILDGDAFNALAKIAILAALIAAVVFVMRAAGGNPSNAGTVYLGLGGVALVLLAILLVMGPNDITGALEDELGGVSLDELGEVAGFDVGAERGIMMYVGLLLAAGVTAGGLMLRQTQSTAGGADGPAL